MEHVAWERGYGRGAGGGGDRFDVLKAAGWEAVTVREHVLRLLCITDCLHDC